MEVKPIDPRVTSWEIDTPAYHVSFWRRGSGPSGVSVDTVAYIVEDCEVRGARDVQEVISWASEVAGDDRKFAVYAVVEHGQDRGLIHLLGVNPSRRGE
jgi:hypothetical protein